MAAWGVNRFILLGLACFGAFVLLTATVEDDRTLPGPEHVARQGEGLLQAMVDAAAPGDVVTVPAGIYRETVVIDKPLTLRGEQGAEIRGSDVWADGWARRGGFWYREGLPELFRSDERCRESSDGRCNWPEQIFINGEPLIQVEGTPGPGEFSVTEEREVVLAGDPTGQLVEVTVREAWVLAHSDDVTVEGFTMRHAAAHPHNGGINIGGYDGWAVQDNVLSEAHGSAISLRESGGHRILGNEIRESGRLGLHLWVVEDVEIAGNRIWGNNTEAFETSWEAGGIKLAVARNVTVLGNEVFENAGPGIWADVDSSNVAIAGNLVYDNERSGIVYELSVGARVHGNVVANNGHGFSAWGFGAGILVQNSSDVEVFDNVVAWNADGIVVISQDRGVERWNRVAGNVLHDNVIIAEHDGSLNSYGLAWLEDWDGVLGDPAANNRGSGNRFWYPAPEGFEQRYRWVGAGFTTVSAFSDTPGGRDSRNLTDEEKDAILAAAGL